MENFLLILGLIFSYIFMMGVTFYIFYSKDKSVPSVASPVCFFWFITLTVWVIINLVQIVFGLPKYLFETLPNNIKKFFQERNRKNE